MHDKVIEEVIDRSLMHVCTYNTIRYDSYLYVCIIRPFTYIDVYVRPVIESVYV